ncbi:unnamed protein product [Arctogadus glacialis]
MSEAATYVRFFGSCYTSVGRSGCASAAAQARLRKRGCASAAAQARLRKRGCASAAAQARLRKRGCASAAAQARLRKRGCASAAAQAATYTQFRSAIEAKAPPVMWLVDLFWCQEAGGVAPPLHAYLHNALHARPLSEPPFPRLLNLFLAVTLGGARG